MKILLSAFLILAAGQACAQASRHLSIADSIRLARYDDSASRSALFSRSRDRWLDSAVHIAPDVAQYWQQRAMPLYKQRKYELGAPFLDSAVKYDEPHAHYLEYRAFMECIFSKKYRAALRDFYAVKAINGNSGVMDHPYDFYIGLCHLQLNAYDSAQRYFQQCVDRRRLKGGDDAVHYLHWFYLGIAHYAQDDYAPAGECFDRCLKQYPNFSDARYYKAICLETAHKTGAALALMRQAKHDLAEGYTINEDNAFYEPYPYQIYKYYVDGYVKYLQAEVDRESATPAARISVLPSGDTMKQYFFVMLKKGPKRDIIKDTAAINRIQAGHMANMERLTKAGKLRVAGPFDDAGDWRGIFILDCDTEVEAKALLAADPAIAAGRLAYEMHPWWTKQGTVFR